MSKPLLTLDQIRERARANAARYHNIHKDEPEYKRKQKEVWQRWYARKKIREQLKKEQSG